MEMVIRWSGGKLYLAFLALLPFMAWLVDPYAGDIGFSVCLFRNLFGIACPGCGTLRGISALLHLDLQRMLELNLLNLVTLPLLSFIYVREVYRTVSGMVR